MTSLNLNSLLIHRCLGKGHQIPEGLNKERYVGDHILSPVLFLRKYLDIIDDR